MVRQRCRCDVEETNDVNSSVAGSQLCSYTATLHHLFPQRHNSNAVWNDVHVIFTCVPLADQVL